MPEEDGIGVFATLHESGFQGELVIIRRARRLVAQDGHAASLPHAG